MSTQSRSAPGNAATLVAVVDDDESVRESLPGLLNELGFGSRTYATAQEFLESGDADRTSCLILDIDMPGMSGPELHRELTRLGYSIPTIFISAHATAIECLAKPFSEAALLEAMKRALLE